ncbi:hypothetical protein BLA29_011186 [Euroglyphus maynei]|uniref:Saposin B-type domain-containing protein n=1 Tax=Euroglyphus maynei TaxID=6958 RepID=A0A1Y3AWB5_EURMA|nr:hypothetical protein BLA29_011186 [Euroglyphus maynei]
MKTLIILSFSMMVLMIQWTNIHGYPSPIEIIANYFKCTAVHLTEQCLDLAYKCLYLINPFQCITTLKCGKLSLIQCAILEKSLLLENNEMN